VTANEESNELVSVSATVTKSDRTRVRVLAAKRDVTRAKLITEAFLKGLELLEAEQLMLEQSEHRAAMSTSHEGSH
jgi:hypothetical protein